MALVDTQQRQSRLAFALLATSIAASGNGRAAEAASLPTMAASSRMPDKPRRIRGLLQAALVGSTYNWRHETAGDALYQPHGNGDGDYTNTAYSDLSLGTGYRVGLGVLWRKLLPSLSLSASVGYEGAQHKTSYPHYALGPFHASSASLSFYEFEVRAMLDRAAIKPYLALESAWVHMALPQQEVIWTPAPPYTYHFVDAWKSGAALNAVVGALYEVLPNISLGLRLGFRRLYFSSTNEGSMAPYGDFAQGLNAALAVEWWP
jgi:hypothetical protein